MDKSFNLNLWKPLFKVKRLDWFENLLFFQIEKNSIRRKGKNGNYQEINKLDSSSVSKSSSGWFYFTNASLITFTKFCPDLFVESVEGFPVSMLQKYTPAATGRLCSSATFQVAWKWSAGWYVSIDLHSEIHIPHLKWLASVIPYSKISKKVLDICSFNSYFST